jgi:hypothetical protein
VVEFDSAINQLEAAEGKARKRCSWADFTVMIYLNVGTFLKWATIAEIFQMS